MFRRVYRAMLHTFTLGRALPDPAKRALLRRMMAFSRELPAQFEQSLPRMMARLTPVPSDSHRFTETEIRRLADAVATWHVRSPLGLCLRRSLLRYHFLRLAGVPLRIVFGARLKGAPEGGGLGGHAWLTLHGTAYYEQYEDYEGFVEVYVYPEAG
ncbi:MAG: lasso peptide biosynthesis B2 protein [Chloroflexota bacterium]